MPKFYSDSSAVTVLRAATALLVGRPVKPSMQGPSRARQNHEAPAEGALGSRSTASGAGNRPQQSPRDQAHSQ